MHWIICARRIVSNDFAMMPWNWVISLNRKWRLYHRSWVKSSRCFSPCLPNEWSCSNSNFFILVSACSKPLGLQNGRLRNSKITASSEVNNRHAAWLGRLGRKKRGGYAGAWCARYNNHYQWMKFDLSRPMRITKVATQGRQDYNQWVTRYTISTSLDGTHWAIYRLKSQDKVGISVYFQASSTFPPQCFNHTAQGFGVGVEGGLWRWDSEILH